jgi:hypothetical protein
VRPPHSAFAEARNQEIIAAGLRHMRILRRARLAAFAATVTLLIATWVVPPLAAPFFAAAVPCGLVALGLNWMVMAPLAASSVSEIPVRALWIAP